MLYRINLDETGGRWIATCDDPRSSCTGYGSHDTMEQAYAAASRDARELKQTSLTVLRPGHGRETIPLD